MGQVCSWCKWGEDEDSERRPLLPNFLTHYIISASTSVKNSKKLRLVFEIILAFGNYLNSNRAPVNGFKLRSLDNLLNLKSSDKSTSLLHYIVATIRHKFPELLSFDSDFHDLDKAAAVSLENLTTDVQELVKGMKIVRKEEEDSHSLVISDFLADAGKKLRKLENDANAAQEAFRKCVEYFAESSRTIDANSFFLPLVRFVKAFKDADQENEDVAK